MVPVVRSEHRRAVDGAKRAKSFVGCNQDVDKEKWSTGIVVAEINIEL